MILYRKVPCQTSTYEVRLQTYDDLSLITFKEDEFSDYTEEGGTAKTTLLDNEKTITIYYATTDINVSSTSKLIDLPTFISSVGGNLGLFVGFSVLGALFSIYDFVALHLFFRRPQ